jgi:hypothetical protein
MYWLLVLATCEEGRDDPPHHPSKSQISVDLGHLAVLVGLDLGFVWTNTLVSVLAKITIVAQNL